MIDTSLPSPENAEQVTFVLVTRCGHVPMAPTHLKAQAFASLLFQANGGLLLTILPVPAHPVITKTNTLHRPPVKRVRSVTTVPLQV